MVTKEEWDEIDRKVASWADWRAKKDAKDRQNKMLIDRVKGIPAQPGTPETDGDPSNPNARP